MAKQGQGVAVAARSRADGDPPGAKPLDLKYTLLSCRLLESILGR